MDIASPVEIATRPQRAGLPAAPAEKTGDDVDIIEEFTLESGVESAIPAQNMVVPKAGPGGETDDTADEEMTAEAGESPAEPAEPESEIAALAQAVPPPAAPPEAARQQDLPRIAAPSPGIAAPDARQPEAAQVGQAVAETPPVAAEAEEPAAPPRISPPPVEPEETPPRALDLAPKAPAQTAASPAPAGLAEVAKPVPPRDALATGPAMAPIAAPQTLSPMQGGETAIPAQDPIVQAQFGWADLATNAPSVRQLPFVTAAPDALRAQNVAAQITGAIRSADGTVLELRLDPPELGRVLIQMSTQDGEMRAVITTERAETAELMRRHADVLGRELARAGLAGADLSFQSEAEQRHSPRMAAGKPVAQFAGAVQGQGAPLSVALVPTYVDGRLDIRL